MSEEEIMKILKDTISLFNNDTYCFTHSDDERAEAIQGLLDLYNKEKEKNKRAEELYMQHNQMIIDILKECNYMIKNRYYMNDTAIRQHAEDIKDIAKYYIKEPEWIEIEEE